MDTPFQRAINISWTSGFDGNSPILKFIVQRREVLELGKFEKPMYCVYTGLLVYFVLNSVLFDIL